MSLDRIGRYQVAGVIGRGGFATVYLGEDRGLDDQVAIKVLSASLAEDPYAVERFVAEARLMRNLHEPGVVTVHDVGEHEGRPYFVMEFCKRGALAARLEALGRPITVDEAAGLGREIGRAVGGMHQISPPVVHRDIKPGNLLVRHRPTMNRTPIGGLLAGDEELIVGDFGLAKVSDPQNTKFTQITYTPGYAPPEQIRGDAGIGPAADVYAASAVLVSALCGNNPRQVFSREDQPFSDADFACAGNLRPVLEQGLAYDSAARHNTIREWADALEHAMHSVPAAAAAPPTTAVPPAPAVALPPVLPAALAAPSAAVSVPPVHPETATHPVAETATAADGSGRSLVGAALAGLVAVAVLAVLIVQFALPRIGGSVGVTGPSEASVGDAVGFFVNDPAVEVQEWRVDGELRSFDPILQFAPAEEGSAEVQAVTVDGNFTTTLTVTESEPIWIAGPGVAPIGQITILTPVGVPASAAQWRIGDQEFQLPRLELDPSTTGVIEVELVGENRQSTRRTIVVPPAGFGG